nr:MAG TPA_asm: hypothetical protein [Bacteriophage sp.]
MTRQFRAFYLCFRRWIIEEAVSQARRVEFPERYRRFRFFISF